MLIVRIGLLTREYPPDVYGGAGVHVEHLVPALRALVDVDVHCFGEPRDSAYAHPVPIGLQGGNFALQTLGVNLAMVNALDGADVAHSHTWYANMAGHLAKILYGVPHVVTAHSLEPRRPWKAEQLGGGYRLSSWVERTAYEGADAVIAVSDGMRADVLDCYPALDPARVHVVHNGIDTEFYHPDPARDALLSNGIDPDKPTVVFVGRITRQKGVGHLIAAAHQIDAQAQIVLCAGAPDTPEIAEETEKAVAAAVGRALGSGVGARDAADDVGAAGALGVDGVRLPVGLRASGDRQPGGDGVRHGGRRLGRRRHPRGRRRRRHRPSRALRRAQDRGVPVRACRRGQRRCSPTPSRAAAMGAAGRERAVREFAWETAAARTVDIYRGLV